MTQTFINVYNLNRKKTAVLQNAFNITETQELNKIYTLTFSIPSDDNKAQYCQPFHYVRYSETGQLYRIIDSALDESDTSVLKVSCEHVIATLVDNVMFGNVQYGGTGLHTAAVIRYILSRQDTQNWVLGECDFDRQFEYNWEQENLLNALYSIPKEFASAYKWSFNTLSYPWQISLKQIDATAKPEYYLRAKRNLLGTNTASDYADICTRIYPLGYGEGVNQLTIKDVNNGVPYLQAPASVVAQYGIKEKVLVDRRFESADSLKAYAQTMLDALQTPSMTRSFSVIDLYPITSNSIDNAEVGKICKLTGDNTVTYITRTSRVLDQPGNLTIDLSTKSTNVADTIADLADRVRIESVYAQGATQLYQHSKDANATNDKGMILSLYFPQEMRQINKVLLKVELSRFRAYSQATESGGGSAPTTEGGSVSGQTSQSTEGGGTINVTLSGSISATSIADWLQDPYTASTEPNAKAASGGGHSHTAYIYYGQTGLTGVPSLGQYHRHTFSTTDYGYGPTTKLGSHTHEITGGSHYHTIPKPSLQHTHTVTVSATSNTPGQSGFAHSHSFNIGSHTHQVNIPAHSHSIAAGIYEVGTASSSFGIYVGGTLKQTISSTRWEGDITQWLLDESGLIPRDSWIKVEIRPNAMAYVISSVFVQGFVQSRGGGNY